MMVTVQWLGRLGTEGNLYTCLMNFSLRAHLEPKDLALRVMFSFVCESKVGFSMRQLTNTQR